MLAYASLKQVAQGLIFTSQLSDPDTRAGFSEVEIDRIASYGKVKGSRRDEIDRITTIVIMHHSKWRSNGCSRFWVEGLSPEARESITRRDI
jgi:hypothetical protein